MNNEESFSHLVRESGTRSDVLYKIELLKEFFEFIFFKGYATFASEAAIAVFAKEHGRSTDDGAYLSTLQGAFLEGWTEQNFYGILADFERRAKTAPALELVIPVALLPIHLKQIREVK